MDIISIPTRWLVAVILSFLTLFPSLAQTNASLSDQFEKALEEENLTGVVWSYIDSKGAIETGAAGIENGQTGNHISPHHRVHVGSITKTLVAVGILRLVSIGKISLDDPVAIYLPDLRFLNPWEKEEVIKIRHLLDHTSGLSDLRLWQMFSQSANPDDPLKLTFSKDENVLKVYAKPGDYFSYSNMGYTLLGMVIESVTGIRYEEYLDENLLGPLGMEQSTFHFVSQEGDFKDPDLAYGHLDGGQLAIALPVFLRPAAQFTTTAKDMGVFINFLLNEGRLADSTFILPDLIKSMGVPNQILSSKNGLNSGYGSGAAYRDRHGVLGKAHSGNIIGYHAMLYWFPEKKTGFFISHNMDSESADYEKFNRILINHLGINSTLKTPASEPLKGMEDWNGFYVPKISKVSNFKYLDWISGFVDVQVKENSLVLVPFLGKPKTLNHLGDRVFQQEGRLKESHVVFTNMEGERIISDGISNLRKVKTLQIGFYWLSAIMGVFSLLSILILVAWKPTKFLYQNGPLTLFYPVLGFIPLFLSIPFFVVQPFVALGDVTVSSVLVFIGTGWFPLGLLISGFQILRMKIKSRVEVISLTLVFFALQWMGILCYWTLIPFRLWL